MPLIRKHSVSLNGHRTSFSLEDAFWQEIRDIAEHRTIPVAALIAEIDSKRSADCNLSSALRLHVLDWIRGRPVLRHDPSNPA